jgi:sugar O-acyltransferase (sialic acid O-acetyltransferase NeuD family)
MQLEKVVIWGSTGQALVVEDILRLRDECEIVGYLDNLNPHRKGNDFGGATVLGGEEALDGLFQSGVRNMILAFANGPAKLKLAKAVRARGFRLITVIHPSACIARTATIGAGTVIRSQVAVGPQTRIGENCILGYGATISHDCTIGDGVHIGSGAHVAGGTRIGRNAWIAVGVTIIDGRTIGKNTTVGAGSTVVKDLPDNVIAYGSPAKPVREVEESPEEALRKPPP